MFQPHFTRLLLVLMTLSIFQMLFVILNTSLVWIRASGMCLFNTVSIYTIFILCTIYYCIVCLVCTCVCVCICCVYVYCILLYVDSEECLAWDLESRSHSYRLDIVQ